MGMMTTTTTSERDREYALDLVKYGLEAGLTSLRVVVGCVEVEAHYDPTVYRGPEQPADEFEAAARRVMGGQNDDES